MPCHGRTSGTSLRMAASSEPRYSETAGSAARWVRTSGRIGVLPHLLTSENIIHLLALHLRARGHLLPCMVSLHCPRCKTPLKSRTCLVIGNSYAHVLHAHLLCPVSAEITSRFAQFGQKSMVAVRKKGQFGQDAMRQRRLNSDRCKSC